MESAPVWSFEARSMEATTRDAPEDVFAAGADGGDPAQARGVAAQVRPRAFVRPAGHGRRAGESGAEWIFFQRVLCAAVPRRTDVAISRSRTPRKCRVTTSQVLCVLFGYETNYL